MKANELRIGNKLINEGYIIDVASIHKEHIEFWGNGVYGECFINEAEPIPLNEEWLVKFGFKKGAISYSIDILPFATEYKKLVVDIFQGILIRNGDEDKGRFNDELITLHNCDVRDKIYVHQLQNLYFALVGKELTINE